MSKEKQQQVNNINELKKTDELYQLPSYEIQDILRDIQNFSGRRDKYREYNFVHNGILSSTASIPI